MKSRLNCVSDNLRTRHRWRYEDDEYLTQPPTDRPPQGDGWIALIAFLLIVVGVAGLIYNLRSIQPQ